MRTTKTAITGSSSFFCVSAQMDANINVRATSRATSVRLTASVCSKNLRTAMQRVLLNKVKLTNFIRNHLTIIPMIPMGHGTPIPMGNRPVRVEKRHCSTKLVSVGLESNLRLSARSNPNYYTSATQRRSSGFHTCLSYSVLAFDLVFDGLELGGEDAEPEANLLDFFSPILFVISLLHPEFH